jgi:hypothetical protein
MTGFTFEKVSFNCNSAYRGERPNPHDSYCLMQIHQPMVGSCAYFKRLIKNYDEQIIDKLVASSNVHYNYQLGDRIIRQDGIEFDRQNHLF